MDRVNDFLVRHGGAAATPARETQSHGGVTGCSEVFAADGYILRCDWSQFGTLREMKYSEIPPRSPR